MGDKCLHQGHRERLRKRFLDFGADALCEHELLELILFYALPRINTNEIAHNLLNEFGCISDLLNTPPSELMKINGIGSAAADFLLLLSDICNEYTFLQSEPPPVSDENGLSDYFCEYFRDSVPGLCLLVTLDEKLGITSRMCFTSESILDETFEVRRTAELLVRSGCNKIAVGINRPNRSPIPTRQDFLIAQVFAEKYVPLNVHLIDCLICSQSKIFSMKKNGAFSF